MVIRLFVMGHCVQLNHVVDISACDSLLVLGRCRYVWVSGNGRQGAA